MSRSYSCYGFSVLEVCVVLIMVSILAGLSAPVVSQMVHHLEWRMASHRLLSALRFTRLTAVSHHRPAALCAFGLHGNWSRGWQVRDTTSSRVYHYYPALGAQIMLHWKGGFLSRQCVIFDRQGFASGSQGRFVLSSPDQREIDIVVSRGGGVRLSRRQF